MTEYNSEVALREEVRPSNLGDDTVAKAKNSQIALLISRLTVSPELPSGRKMSAVLEAEAAPDVKTAVVMRVVFPEVADIDALPLYIDGGKRGDQLKHRPECIQSRRSVTLKAEEWMSFGSYFNAFPAGYWAEWTAVRTVLLTVKTKGIGSVIVYRSNATGVISQEEARQVEGSQELTFELPLTKFGDGGRYWFDLVAGSSELTLVEAAWSVPESDRRSSGTPSIAITTMNRPEFCTDVLTTLGQDPMMKELIDRVYVVDQGTKKVSDHKNYSAAAELLGDQLQVIEQANIGGSGGFSRGMYETATAGVSEYTLLLDDDILVDTESISRAVTFANFTKKETIVGGHMLHLSNRSVLLSFGEAIDPFYWGFSNANRDQLPNHNFADQNYRDCNWMHQRVDVGYNAWWMCLIPVSTIKKIGLSMPYFIKWDDAEYCLRARAHNVRTVSLPGAAVWHMDWTEKDDMVGWQAYYHARNRLISALLHSPFSPPLRLLRVSYALEVKHNVSMQYYTAEARLMALRDLLEGPDSLSETIHSRIGELRSLMSRYPDGDLSPSRDAYPAVVRKKPIKALTPPKMAGPAPVVLGKLALRGVSLASRQLLVPVKNEARTNPELVVSHRDNKWFNTGRFSSAIVTNSEGTGFWWYKRDPELSRRNIAEATKLYARLTWNWKKLSRQYKDALSEITSFESWERIFGIEARKPRD